MAKHRVKMSEVVRSTQSVQESTDRSGGKADYMKLGPKLNKILILPPWNGKDLMKRLLIHQVWKGGKPVAMATSPRIEDGAEDMVMDYGFRLKEKYEDSPNKKKQDLWKKYMPSDSIVVNALNLDEKNPTPKVLRLPAPAVKFLCDEVGEVADGDEIWDLEKGHPLIIKGNGKNGNNRRYEYAKFSKNAAGLISEGRVDEDAILDGLHDLDKLLPKVDEKRLKKVLQMLKQQDQVILNGEGSGGEEDEEESDETDDDEDEKPARKAKKKSRDEDEEDSDEEEVDAEDDDDEGDFEDEKPKKKSKVAAKPKRKSSDDEDEEETDEADDDEEDEDDRKPVKKNLKVAAGKKTKRKVDEDEDSDEELDEEALDDDDEEDEQPARKKVQKKAASGLRKKR